MCRFWASAAVSPTENQSGLSWASAAVSEGKDAKRFDTVRSMADRLTTTSLGVLAWLEVARMHVDVRSVVSFSSLFFSRRL
jgi:hypothetical protein